MDAPGGGPAPGCCRGLVRMGDHPPPGRGHLVAITSRAGIRAPGVGCSAITTAERRTVPCGGPGGIDVSASSLLEVLGYGGCDRPVLEACQATEPWGFRYCRRIPSGGWVSYELVGDRARGERYDRARA